MSPLAAAPRIGLATYERAPLLAPDDQLVPPALAALGARALPVVWSDARVRWEELDGVLIRSCWDYHLRSLQFHDWLDRLDRAGVPVWNSTAIVRWNADKGYLIDLAARGVATVPTLVVTRGHPESVATAAASNGWMRFVVKPAISASGYQTRVFDAPLDAADREAIRHVLALGDALVQPFVDEVTANGELSFTFIDGAPSHTALKRAAPGEFRVQVEHGGSTSPVAASQELVSQAAAVLRALPETPLYARVDGVVVDQRFVLMELELIEPNLHLSFSEHAAARLAEAIMRRLRTA